MRKAISLFIDFHRMTYAREEARKSGMEKERKTNQKSQNKCFCSEQKTNN